MGAQHTPGPWHAGTPIFGLYHIYADTTVGGKPCISGRQHICTAPYEGKKGAIAYHEMFTANARLIAAAPELLAALEQVLATHDYHTDDGKEAADFASSVIDKATGANP